MPKLRYFLFALLLAALGAAGYASYRSWVRQAAILTRMEALGVCLAARDQQRAQAAAATVGRLAEAVRKNHNLASDVAVLKESEQIQARTKRLADTLALMRRQWQQAGSSTKLLLLVAQLNRYVAFIQRYHPEAEPLTWQPATTGWPAQADPTAEPLPAALATLTRLETQVRQYEALALIHQAAKVDGGDYFYKIGAFAFATSETVAPGALYEARLFLSQGATGLKQEMSADGQPVSIDLKTGHGAVRFQVPAARPGQPDTVRATWRGAIRVNNDGRDTVFVTQVPYFIVQRPTL